MIDNTEQEKEALRQELRQMIAEGTPQEEIVAHKQAKLAEIEGKQNAVQPGAPVQQGEGIQDTDSSLAPTSLASQESPELGDWENFTNNVQNVWTRVLGFDDRLTVATVDVMDNLFGKETADKIWKAMPTKDTETGEWLDSSEEVRAAAFREIEESNADMLRTKTLTDEWEKGDVGGLVSAAAGAGLNMMSTLITSGLTAGAGLYTDMIGDAIYDSNTEKAKKLGISVQELYDRGESEFAVPAAVGVAGGMLERLGAYGVGKYIKGTVGKVAGETGKKAYSMIQNMGVEGLTEWTQTGLEVYNREHGAGNEYAPGVALDAMFSREGLEAALQGAVGAGVGGGAGRGGKFLAKRAGEKLGLTKGNIEATPSEEYADAIGDEDYLFDSKVATQEYKSQIESIAKAKEILDKEFTETTPEQRDAAREVIQDEETAKKEEETRKRYTRQLVQELNDEYDGTVENPTEAGRIAYVATKLGEEEGINTFDEALGMAKAKNRDVLNVVSKAFIAARTPQEAQLVDDINSNLESAKVALEKAPEGPQRDALQELVDGYGQDLANLYATANRKVLYADPVAVGKSIEAQSDLESLNNQEAAVENSADMADDIKARVLANIEEKRDDAIERGQQAREEMEKTSSKNIEETDTMAKYFEEVLKEEALDNTKSTDDLVRGMLDLGVLEDPDSDPVIDETMSASRQPIDVVDGVKHYGKRAGGILPTRTEAIQAGKQIELEAKSKGYKTDVTYTDVNPERAGGETQVEVEVYKPREGSLKDAVQSKQNEYEQPDQEGAVEEAGTGVEEGERTPLDYVQDFAEGAQKTALPGGELFIPAEEGTSPKDAGAYRAVGGLKKRGHTQAKFDQIGGGFLVTPGPRDTDTGVDYSIDENGRAHDEDGKFVSKEDVDYNIDEVAQDQSPEAPTNFTQHQDLRSIAGNRVKMNIGLENNPIGDIDGIIDKLDEDPRFRLGSTEQVNGEYNGEPERTVVVDAKFDGSARDFRDLVEKLNKDMTQEAIGVTFNNRGSLIYDPAFKGEKYEFSDEFFLQPTKTAKSPAAQTGVTERKSEEIKEQRPPKAKSDPREKFEDIARIKPSEIRVPGAVRGEVPTYEGGALQSPSRELGDESLEPSFDRELANEVRTTPIQDLKTEPNITEDMIEGYNNGTVPESQFARSLAKYISFKQPDADLQGFAVEKMLEQMFKGNFKGKNRGQVFSKAKAIANSAPTLKKEAEGLSRDQIAESAKVRRGNDAFYAEFGWEPGLDELADYVNEKYGIDIDGKKVEQALYGPKSAAILGGTTGDIGQKSQAQVEANIGFDDLSNVIFGRFGKKAKEFADKVDGLVSDISSQRPIEESTGEFADQAPRRGAGFKTTGDKAAARVKKSGTLIDQDLQNAVGKLVTPDILSNNFGAISQSVGRPGNNWNDLSRAEKQNFKRKVVKGLISESEGRLGKTTTPSQELDFDIEAGDSTFTTDLGKRSKHQVNSHRRPWDQTAKEINSLIKSTDFDNDWVQWSPGHLDPTSDKAKQMNPARVRELLKQPARVYKLAAKNGLELRKDSKNPGLYHIYKPGKIGSKPEFNLTENQAANTKADDDFIKKVTAKLNEAWPDHEVVYDPFRWTSKIQDLKLNGVSAPWDKMKGFVTGNKVYLSPTKVGYDTPIHEFGHVWSRQLMRENPELWKKGKELLKGSDYAKAVYDIPTYRDYLRDNPSKFWEEVMANAIGKRGAVLFDSKQEASAWDKWMKNVGDWIKSALGISSKDNYNDLTLDQWLDTAVQGVFSGKVVKPSDSNIEYDIESDPSADPDVSAAYLRGKQNQKKWYDPRSWAGMLVPPAADDYHGLVSKLKNIPGIKSVTDAFVKNHQKHIDNVTKARADIKRITKKLGIPLDKKNVTTYKGNKLNAAQAIQAHVNGHPNEFSNRPEVQEYIDAMTELGVLKPNERYDLASPAQDLYEFLNNDLYKRNFSDFNAQKGKVFNEAVMNQIRAEHGENYAEALELALQRMSSGKNSKGFTDKTTQKWNDWALGSVGTIMFLNFRSAALQLMSVGNFGFETQSPGKFIANFFNPSTYADAKKLFNSSYLKERRTRAGFDVNAQEMVDLIQNSKTFSDFTKNVLNKGFAATSLVDSMAIAMGGAAFIKAETDSGVPRAEAIKKWKEATEEAQQSARPDRVSQWQTEGISKFVLAFANTPQQYFRLSQKAYRSIREGKDVKKNLAKIGYYMAIQNMLFTAAQAASTALLGFGDDDDDEEERDQLSSMAGTVLRGMGLYGAVIDAVKNVAVQAIKEEGKANPDHVNSVLKATSISPPLNRKIQDLLAIGRAHKYDSDDKYATTVTRGIAATTNLPADWAHKKYDATMALWDDQYSAYQKVLMMMGWSKWNFKDKGDDNFDFDLDLDLDDLDVGDLDF